MTLLWIISILVIVGYVALLAIVVLRPATPFVRRLAIALTAAAVILAALHALSTLPIAPFWQWFLNLDSEQALGAMFSSVQGMGIALTALALALGAPGLKLWQRAYFLLMGLVFTVIALDEYFMIHERVGSAGDLGLTGRSAALDAYLLLLGSAWRTLYVTVGGLLAVINVLAFWFGFRHEGRDEARLIATLIAGLGLMAGGGLALDIFAWDILFREIDRLLVVEQMVLMEEFLEMSGAALILIGMAGYAERRLSLAPAIGRLRVAAAAAALWLMFMLLSLGPIPALQARLFGTPVQADLLGGAVSLIAYELSSPTARAGDDLDVTLYLRANTPPPPGAFTLTVQVLQEPEMTRLAGFSAPVDQYTRAPLRAWVPGMVIRQTVRLTLPDTFDAPASYPIMVRVWAEDQVLPITDTDRRLIGEDTLILANLAAAPAEPIPAPPTTAEYRFADGVTLYGYSLPEAPVSGTLPIAFWWHTDDPSGRYLVQFVHIFGAEGQLAFNQDQEPFGGTFPTSVWPPDFDISDEWAVPLPADLPPGMYTMHTGLYEWPSLERVAVIDGAGQPVPDASIRLGSIEVR